MKFHMPQPITSSSYNEANQQLALGDKMMTFDHNGNLITLTDSGGATTYTWNARNQLVGISGPGVTASFVYDGLDRREKKTINGSLTEFLYDGVNPVQESSGATVLANNLAGLDIDEFLARSEVAAGTTSYFIAETLGSAIALADPAGAVQTEYTYESFGKTTITGVGSSNSYQYTGRENDGTGLYYYRARYYHIGMQRFLSEDPLGFKGGDVNLYSYVINNPLNAIDPSGMRVLVLPGRCGSSLPGPDLMRKLNIMSECVGQTIIVTSGQRSVKQINCAGGAPNSQHLGPEAADIQIPGWTPEQIGELARCQGFRGIIIYSGHTHVDMRPVPWFGRNGRAAPQPRWWNSPVCCCPEE